jgi:predicted metal-dependent phosphoesterase TrpH
MIDLHMHTTASDGRCQPEELVRLAYDKGIRTMSVTDHDTMASVPRAAAAATALGMNFIPGIEITSVHGGRDVHVLAYFLPTLTEELNQLLAEQRKNRIERAQVIAERLAAAGAPIDVDALMEAGAALGGKSLARPQIAQALIAAGHVATVAEAFERFLGEDGPAYVPHRGASPAEVVDLICRAGGVASLAHPGYTKKDEVLPELIAAGLGAIEAYHSAHDEPTTRRYVEMAHHYGVAVSGGSDFHGEGTRRSEFFGVTNLPAEDFKTFSALSERARETAAHRLAMAWDIA